VSRIGRTCRPANPAGRHGWNQLNGEAALDLAGDDALDDFAVLENLFETRPGFGALGLLAGQQGVTHAVVQRVNHHIHRIAHCDFKFATIVQELFAGNHTFRLEAGVYSDPDSLMFKNLLMLTHRLLGPHTSSSCGAVV
jgi:hypothetical protein